MTPAEVRTQQFRVVFRGYDVEQVDAFLDRVQATLRTRTSPPAAPATAPAPEPADGSSRALRVLEAAEQAGEQLLGTARTEAEGILATARVEAEQLRLASADDGARLRAQARAEAAETMAEARSRVNELEDRRLTLAAEVERLEAQERTCRDRLQRTLQDTLRQVSDGFAAELVPQQLGALR